MKCFFCSNQDATFHHIFEGTGKRRICEEYHLVIPLCWEHHTGARGYHYLKSRETKEVWRMSIIGVWLNLDYYKTVRAINNRLDRGYLEEHKERLLKIRSSYERD